MKNEIPRENYLSESCYLYFPKEDEILLNIENFSFRRFFFHVRKFTDFEENLLTGLKEMIEQLIKNEFIKSLVNDKEKLMRFLHLTNNNEDSTIKILTKYSKLSLEYNIFTEHFKIEENITQVLNSGILKLIGRDKKMRPIIQNNLNVLSSLKDSIEDIIKSYIIFMKFIVENMLLPGQIEQVILVIKPNNKQDFNKMFVQIFEYIQLYFPCRFNNIFVLIDENNPDINFTGMLEYTVPEYNKECINIINKTNLFELSYNFSKEIINQIIKDIPQDRYYPPYMDDKITFDTEKEKLESIISKKEYLLLYSDPDNRSFYKLNEMIIYNNFKLEVFGSKEFNLENFETFNPKLIKMKKNDNNSIETEENSIGKDKKDLSKINEKIKMIKNEYNVLKTNKINLTNKGNKPRYTKKNSADSKKVTEEIKNRMANKSFSFLENESFDNLNRSGTSEKFDIFDKNKVRSNQLDSKQRGFIIDCSQRNESCCKLEDKCLII